MDSEKSTAALASVPSSQEKPHQRTIIDQYPLSQGQRALWFIQQLQPNSVAHNIVYAVRVLSRYDHAALIRAFNRVIERHPTLRTTYQQVNGEPAAQVYDHFPFEIQFFDAAGWTKQQFEAEFNRQMFSPFNLERGPLVRLFTYQLAPDHHIWMLCKHHIITDMWSMGLFLNELSEIYTEEVTGKPANIRPVSGAYRDYVMEQEKLLSSPEGEQLFQYWAEKLSGELPVLDLITDHPRPPILTDHGSSVVLRFDDDLFKALKQLAGDLNTTLHNLVLAGFELLLHKYTGQNDVVIGYPKFGRSRQMARVLGYFINPIALRSHLNPSIDFKTYLENVSTDFQESSRHDSYPFRMIVERLQPGRDLSRSAIFQVMFAWQKTAQIGGQTSISSMALGEDEKAQVLKLGELSYLPVNLPSRVVPFDLTLLMAETEGELVATVEYNIDLYEKATVQRLLDHFQVLLRNVVNQPDSPLGSLSLVSADEQALITSWNNTSTGEGLPEPVHVHFEQQVAQTPDQVALITENETFTYQQLNQRANQLAHHLQKVGCASGAIVGVCLPRSADLTISILAIFKAGLAYLPLDPTYPADRLNFILSDAGAQILITHTSLLSRFSTPTGKVVYIDQEWPHLQSEESTNLDLLVEKESLAYIIYTSGSTGRPKGVMVDHGPFAGHIRDIQRHFAITSADRVLQFAPVNFDPSLEQTFTAFLTGATLVLRSDRLWEPQELIQKINQYKITVMNFPPAYWHQVAEVWAKTPEKVPAHLLKLVIIGGDVLKPESVRLWWQTPMRQVRLLNAYGPTEAIITATTCEVNQYGETILTRSRTPIGKPIANLRAYILDPYLNPVPVGVPGELYLAGPSLARGYINYPDLTADRFLPDPFAREANARMYRTGDRAVYLPDGHIDFFGRTDSQVKVRGFRVELGEIEVALLQNKSVKEAVVVAVPQSENGNRLAAYYVLAHDSTGQIDLRQYLSDRLPAYMVPSAFIPVDTIPLTPSGKLDRKNLPDPFESGIQVSGSYVAPRDAVEEEIAKLWAEVLKVPQVGVYDNFFELGGHSLIATQLVARVRELYQVELPLHHLFETPTVAGISEAVFEALAGKVDETEMDTLLAQLEELSEEEVQEILAQRGPGN